MDYDDLTMNGMQGDNETEASSGGGGDQESERKTRRYWSPKEEDRFYEIWGRENWRLTRHGKNTVHFAKWSQELVERFKIDVKPEEVQTKVNQTKAKYRQVVKHMNDEKTTQTKWKKFEVIDKILRNEYRSKDDEPIPVEALEKSREFSPLQPQTGTACTAKPPQANDSLTAAATDGANGKIEENNQNNLDLSVTESIGNNSIDLDALNHECGMFNNSDSQRSTSQFSTELFTDPIDEIKQDDQDKIFHEDFSGAYSNSQNSNLYSQAQNLTQLQTVQPLQHQQPQQQNFQFEQHQQPQHHEQYQELYPSQTQLQETAMLSQQQQLQQETMQHLEQQQQLQQQQQQQTQQQPHQQPMQQQANFEQSLNPFASSPCNQRSLLIRNQNQYSDSGLPLQKASPIQPTNDQYVNNYSLNSSTPTHTENQSQALAINNGNSNSKSKSNCKSNSKSNSHSNNNSNSNSNNVSTNDAQSMQPPRTNAVVAAPVTQTRKRRTSMQIAAANAAAAAAAAAIANPTAHDSLELLYMEEVRKKNSILDEQKEISRKRLLLEERKIALMEQFFPRCLELQERILQKLNSK